LQSWVHQALKIPVLLGRDFNDRDDAGAPRVGIVNQKFANRYFGDANPLGRHVGMGNPGAASYGDRSDERVEVGVAREARYREGQG
jgi:hypothetical protein